MYLKGAVMRVRKKWLRCFAGMMSMILLFSMISVNTVMCFAAETETGNYSEDADSDEFGAPVRTLTVKYVNTAGEKLFQDNYYTVRKQNGSYQTDLTIYNEYSSDWRVSVYRQADGTTIKNPSDYDMRKKNQTVELVLVPKEAEPVVGETVFYDYTVAPYTGNKYFPLYDEYTTYPEKSINTPENYQNPEGGNKLSAGTGKNQDYSQNYKENQHEAWINGMDANVFYPNSVTAGIVTGLSADYSEVLFGVDEPGFFSSEPKAGKTIINGYKLKFEKKGYTYNLMAVLDENGNETTRSGSDFWPLENVQTDWQQDNRDGNISLHNYYFGMRYDIAFTLGDYQGPLNYSFSGDDDVWVLLDGEVILDLGGIHNTLYGNVDLWNCDAIRNSAPDEVHHLTVLYMERGANASNCTMSFVIPNAVFEEVPTADITINKQDAGDGYALEGAAFKLVSDSNTAEWTEAVSGADGKVTFTNLAAGTYTLTEEVAPNGYLVSENSWKVMVVPTGKYTVAASLYEADGVTPVENHTITNQRDGTVPDPSGSHVTQKKTAKLIDWAERSYKIDLYAAHDLAVLEPVNIVMALDISGSMAWFVTTPTGGRTRLYDLTWKDRKEQTLERGGATGTAAWDYTYYVLRESEEGAYEYKPIAYDAADGRWKYVKSKSSGEKVFASGSGSAVSSQETIYIRGVEDQTKFEALVDSVTNFVNNLKAVSPDSQIGFVLFAGENKKSIALTNVGGVNVNTLFDVPLYGNTNQMAALKEAAVLVDAASGGASKNIVLFSDGAPNASGISMDLIRQTAEEIKASGMMLYTAGIFRDTRNEGYKGLKEWASADCAFLAATAPELINAFKAVFASINASISNVTIRDYIDARFVLTDRSGTALHAGDVVGGGIVGYDSGSQLDYVEWTGQTLGYAGDPVSGWHQTLYVRAKETYIGGNNVTTNAPASGITAEGVTVPFDQPTVNVRLGLELKDVSEVIFYGEKAAQPDEVLAHMLETAQVQIGEAGGAVNLAEDFEVRWYADENLTEEIAADTIKENAAQGREGVYYCKVIYRVSSPTQESLVNSDNRQAEGTLVNGTAPSRDYAVYTLRVVKGEIDLLKVIDKPYTDINNIYANQNFIFKVEQYAVTEDYNGREQKGGLEAVFYVSVSFDANGTVTSGSSKICGLKKGYYTVTEETAWTPAYRLTQVVDNDVSNQTEGVDLLIGRKINHAGLNERPEYFGLETFVTKSSGAKYTPYADGIEATAVFINEKVKEWKWLCDAASAINKFIHTNTF